MSDDRSPRPVRSFLAKFFGFARHHSRQTSQSRRPSGNNTGRSHQPAAGAISTPPLAHAVAQQSSATMVAVASVARQDCLSAPPPFLSSPSPSPSRESLEDVSSTGINPAPIRGQVPSSGTLLQQVSSNQGPSGSQAVGQVPFYQAHDFVMNNPVFVDNGSDNFMTSFLQETIPRAEFDSSDPNMPLRCHPGTRLEIIKRCQDFVLHREGRPRLRWVVGAAGVGKSAIMQSVARDEFNILLGIIVGATIFFSINGRRDGTKAITTIAYQLAIELNPYRLFIQREIARNPSLLRKSLSTQFEKFIIKPFIHERIIDPSSRLLIIIDGLDECANPLMQQELLGLISDFCITYPTSPIVWMIASRPEPHITSFFSQPKIALSYEKEEILVDSGDAHEDVKRYLHDKFGDIQMASIVLQHLPQWPSEGDFFKVAEASGGLFAYASTVIRYISDPTYGDPVSQLDDVLTIIETGTNSDITGEGRPMAQLDALYARIMSRIPAKVRASTRKLLLIYVGGPTYSSFQLTCNMLGITKNAAYGATHHIHAIASVPGPDKALHEDLQLYHKSFADYLRDYERSEFSFDIMSEVESLVSQFAWRVFEEAPDGVQVPYARDYELEIDGGFWRNGPGTGDNISLSWPDYGNSNLELRMFREAVLNLIFWVRNAGAFESPLCMRVLTTCFAKLPNALPFKVLSDFIFDESRRCERLDHGILKQVPLETLASLGQELIQLRFRSPVFWHYDPWNAFCKHEREGSWEGHSYDRPNRVADMDEPSLFSRAYDWSTQFVDMDELPPRPQTYDWSTQFVDMDELFPCEYCLERFVQQSHIQLPNQLITVFEMTPVDRLAELQFVDPDGVSKWVYHVLARKDRETEAEEEEMSESSVEDM